MFDRPKGAPDAVFVLSDAPLSVVRQLQGTGCAPATWDQLLGVRPAAESGSPQLSGFVEQRLRWQRRPFAGIDSPTLFSDAEPKFGGFATELSASGEWLFVGLRLRLADGARVGATCVGDNAVVPALTPEGSLWVVSVVEFPGIDLDVLRRQQDAAAVPLRIALLADLVGPLQQSALVGLDEDGRVRWRTAMPVPVVDLATIADDVVGALDAAANLAALDARTGMVIARLELPPSGAYFYLSGDASGIVAGGSYNVQPVRFERGVLSLDEPATDGTAPSASGGVAVFSDLGGQLRIAEIGALDSAEPLADGLAPVYPNGAWILPESDYVVEAAGGGGVVIHDRSNRQRVAVFDDIHPVGDFHVWPLDGDRFVSLTGSGEVLRWDLSRDAVRKRACELAGRDLTIEEWDTYLSGEDVRSTCEQAIGGS